MNQSAATISQLKTLFNTQFGVTPYVVVDQAYFADPAMQSTADNEFVWDTLHNSLPNNLSSYSFSGVRLDHAMVKWDPLDRNYFGNTAPNFHIANAGDGLIKDDSYLIPALANSGPSGDNANVLVLATWNDLGEGTGINRNYDYYWGGQLAAAQRVHERHPGVAVSAELRDHPADDGADAGADAAGDGF